MGRFSRSLNTRNSCHRFWRWPPLVDFWAPLWCGCAISRNCCRSDCWWYCFYDWLSCAGTWKFRWPSNALKRQWLKLSSLCQAVGWIMLFKPTGSRPCFLCTTHTHTLPFNGPLSGTTRVSRCQKGKTNLDFTEARDSEWQWHQLGHMQVCTSLQADTHASTPLLKFLQAGCPSCRPANSFKAL